MEDNFRNILIILSAIVITAIFIHGLWTIRKQKNPYKLKTTKDKIDPISRDFDRKGFDQDGVGQVKVTRKDDSSIDDTSEQAFNNPDEKSDLLSKSQTFRKSELNTEPKIDTQAQRSKGEHKLQQTQEILLDNAVEDDWFKESSNPQFTKDELGDELTANTHSDQTHSEIKAPEPKEPVNIEPLYAQPVTQAKPVREPIKRVKKSAVKDTLKRNQIEIDFDNQAVDSSNNTSETIEEKTPVEAVDPQVIILSVVMPANQQMLGAALLPSLLTLGLKYGEMNIFHRHEDNAGKGKVTFSLANIMNPGSFDLDSMENFATRGVSLFMTLPNAGEPLNVFEQMLNAAKQLAQEFNAQVIDENRNVMTKQTEQHYISKIREFDRKSRIALVN